MAISAIKLPPGFELDEPQAETPTYDTKLSPSDEDNFKKWKSIYAPNDSGADYDLRGAFKAGLKPSKENGHWPDTYKKPNHPTFSDQSIYASSAPDKAGSWNGETYIPPKQTPQSQSIKLPEGFVLDEETTEQAPQSQSIKLPHGFELDEPQSGLTVIEPDQESKPNLFSRASESAGDLFSAIANKVTPDLISSVAKVGSQKADIVPESIKSLLPSMDRAGEAISSGIQSLVPDVMTPAKTAVSAINRGVGAASEAVPSMLQNTAESVSGSIQPNEVIGRVLSPQISAAAKKSVTASQDISNIIVNRSENLFKTLEQLVSSTAGHDKEVFGAVAKEAFDLSHLAEAQKHTLSPEAQKAVSRSLDAVKSTFSTLSEQAPHLMETANQIGWEASKAAIQPVLKASGAVQRGLTPPQSVQDVGSRATQIVSNLAKGVPTPPTDIDTPESRRMAGDIGVPFIQAASSMLGFVPLVIGPDNKVSKSVVKMARWWEDTLRQMDPKDKNIVDNVIQGVVSTAPFYIAGMGIAGAVEGAAMLGPIAVKLAPYIGAGVQGTMEAAQNAGQIYLDLTNEGTDPKEAVKRADVAFWQNVIWNAALNKAGGLLDSEKRGILMQSLRSAPAEGIQEWGQTVIEYLNKRDYSKPFDWKASMTSNEALMSGGIGGLVGALFGGAHGAVLQAEFENMKNTKSANRAGTLEVEREVPPTPIPPPLPVTESANKAGTLVVDRTAIPPSEQEPVGRPLAGIVEAEKVPVIEKPMVPDSPPEVAPTPPPAEQAPAVVVARPSALTKRDMKGLAYNTSVESSGMNLENELIKRGYKIDSNKTIYSDGSKEGIGEIQYFDKNNVKKYAYVRIRRYDVDGLEEDSIISTNKISPSSIRGFFKQAETEQSTFSKKESEKTKSDKDSIMYWREEMRRLAREKNKTLLAKYDGDFDKAYADKEWMFYDNENLAQEMLYNYKSTQGKPQPKQIESKPAPASKLLPKTEVKIDVKPPSATPATSVVKPAGKPATLKVQTDIVNISKRMLPHRTTLPILSQIFIDEKGNASMTDLETMFTKNIGKEKPSGMYEVFGKNLEKTNLSTEDFPPLPNTAEMQDRGSIDKATLHNELSKAETFSSTNETRYVLLGTVMVRVNNGKAIFVATDGRRMSFNNVDVPNLKDGKYVVRNVEKVLHGLASTEGNSIQLKIDDKNIAMIGENGTTIAQLSQSEYPLFEQVIPKTMETQIVLSKSGVEKIISEVAPYLKKTGGSPQVVIGIVGKDAQFSVRYGQDVKKVTIPVESVSKVQYKPIDGSIIMPMRTSDKEGKLFIEGIGENAFSVNLDYLRDAVKNVSGDKVFIGLSERDIDPIHISDYDQSANKPWLEEKLKVKKGKKTKDGNLPAGGSANASRGAETIDQFEKSPPGTSGQSQKMQLSDEVRKVYNKYEVRVGERYVSGEAGLHYVATGNVRLNALNDVAIAAHEISHAFDKRHAIMKRVTDKTGTNVKGNPMYNSAYNAVRKALTNVYVKHYPGGKKNHKLSKRITEGYATFIQKYIEQPTQMTTEYPELVRDIVSPGGRFYNSDIAEMIRDYRKIIEKYQALDPLSKVGSKVTMTFKQNGIKDSFLTWFDKVITQTVDEIYPLKKLAKMAGVERTIADPSLWARQYSNSSALILNNFKGDGFWTVKNGDFVKVSDDNLGDLVTMLQKTGSTKDFSDWLVARDQHYGFEELDILKQEATNAAKLLDELKDAEPEEGEMSVSDIEAAIKAAKMKIKVYQEHARVMKGNGFDRDVVRQAYIDHKERFIAEEKIFDMVTQSDLKLLVESRLITGKKYAELSGKKGYSPIKRDVYDEVLGQGEKSLPAGRTGPGRISSMIGRKGSQLDIVSPIASLFKDHAEVVRKSMKQIVLNKIYDVSAQFPDLFQEIKLVRQYDPETGITKYPQDKDPELIIARKPDGTRVPLLVSREIKMVVDDLFGFNEVHVFERLMRRTASIFTKGTTGAYPLFAPTNFVVDQFTAAAQTRNKYIPLYDTIPKIVKALRDHGSVEARYLEAYLASGGERQTFARWQDLQPDEFFNAIAGEKKALEKVLDLIDTGMDAVSWISSKSEVVTRATEYIKSRMAGNPHIVALEDAGEVSVPFHHIGKWGGGTVGKTLVKSSVFFNPGIQAMFKYGQTLGDKSTRNRALFVTLAVIAASVGSMAYLMKKATKKQKDLYSDLEANELVNYIWFPSPDGERLWKIKIPREMGTIATVINMALANLAMGSDFGTKDFVSASTAFLPDQFNVTDPVRAFFTLIPQMVKPGLMVLVGKKDWPTLRPMESKSLENKEPGQRFTQTTSEYSKWLGNKLNMSPIKIDYLIEGYFGRITRFATWKPITNPFTREYYFTAGRNLQDYYEMREDIMQKSKSIKLGTYKPEGKEMESFVRQIGIVKNTEALIKVYRGLDKIIDKEKISKSENERQEGLRRKILDNIGALRHVK